MQSEVFRKGKRRDGEATRERIIAAAIELLSQEGISNVSTGRLAREAGVVQSGFYAHFASIEECVVVAAERIGQQLRELAVQEMTEKDTVDPKALARFVADILARLEGEWTFVELMLRYRQDPSPLGTVMSRFFERLREDVVNNLIEVAPDLGIQDHERPLLTPAAHMIVMQFVVALESLRESRVPDSDLLAKHIAAQIQLSAHQGYEVIEAQRSS